MGFLNANANDTVERSTILAQYNPVHHKRTKHIEIKYHFIRDKVKLNEIVVDKIHTSDMLADILTKNLPTRIISNLIPQLMGGGDPILPSPKRIRIYKKIINCEENNQS